MIFPTNPFFIGFRALASESAAGTDMPQHRQKALVFPSQQTKKKKEK